MIGRRRVEQAGDTLIEVLLAITIFSVAVAGVFFVMNHSIGVSQRSLEITQVRMQIDNQVELLRHINNIALVSSGRDRASIQTTADSGIATTWKKIKQHSFRGPVPVPDFESVKTIEDCTPEAAIPYASRNGSFAEAFFIDPATGDFVLFQGANAAPPATFARVTQQPVPGGGVRPVSQMVWIYAVHGSRVSDKDDRLKGGDTGTANLVDYYDFHVRACWQSPVGSSIHSLGTIVRLYEPL